VFVAISVEVVSVEYTSTPWRCGHVIDELLQNRTWTWERWMASRTRLTFR